MDVWDRFVAKIGGGRFSITDRPRFRSTLRRLEGGDVEIAIRRARKKRTLSQNAYLHVIAREIEETTGEDLDRIKRVATLEALGIEAGTEKEVIFGCPVVVVRRTSDLPRDECSKVLDNLLEKAQFLEIRLPNREHVEVMD